MRFIDLQLLEFPNDWLERAENARADMEQLEPSERLRTIGRHSRVWSDLKEKLEKCSAGKCWYCESKQERSDNHIDHFRPKARVAECLNHSGYWWLAFSWENYRFSCTYCNSRRRDRETRISGGKQDNFPVFDEACRAHSPDDDIELEMPLLLDPTRRTDPALLWFDPGGEAVPRYTQDDHPRLYKRANISIHLYHLNYTTTKERRNALYNDIIMQVRDVDRYFQGYDLGSRDIEHAFERAFERLGQMLEPREEYSAAARAYLLGLRRNDRQWLEGLLSVS